MARFCIRVGQHLLAAAAAWWLDYSSHSQAADKRWINRFGGAFNAAANWSGGVPGTGDVAVFGISSTFLSGTYTVDFDVFPTNQAIKIEDDNVTFDFAGHSYTTTEMVGNQIGDQAGHNGRLTITGGIMVVAFQSDLEVGAVANASGLLTVSTGGQLIGSPFLFVGALGTGTLAVQNGGDIITDKTFVGTGVGATGTANITGSGSALFADQLTIGSQGNGTLNIAAAGQVESNDGFVGSVAGSTGAVNVDGASSLWNNLDQLRIGEFGHGTINITAGGRVQDAVGNIGFETDSIGEVTVSGAGSQWINSSQLTVGFDGSGTLHITTGGQVQNSGTESFIGFGPGSTGEVTVDGANSQWFNSGEVRLGSAGTGTIGITAGGTVQNTVGTIGRANTGTVTVSGTNSRWINSERLAVGDDGRGTLNITAGGRVDNTIGNIGQEDDSIGTANITGANSQWINSDELSVGFNGSGMLDISSGARVQNTNGFVGRALGAGMATVSGANSQWINSGDLTVGRISNGTLTITVGGRVQNTNGFVARFSSSTATATVSGAGSAWTMNGRLSIGGDASTSTNGGAGTLNIQSGGTVSVAQDTAIFPNGLVRLEGGTFSTAAIIVQSGGHFIWTSGTLHAGVVNFDLQNPNGGVLAPGNSAGSTVIQGNYTQQSGAVLQMEIGGTAATSTYDFVNITGAAALGGQLELSLLGAFRPNLADQFTILSTFGGVTGAFSNVANGQRLTTSDGNGSFLVHYGPGSAFDPNTIVLSAFEAVLLPGDYNQNGVVDAADYIMWRKTQGQMGMGLAADGNGNSQIDPGDYNVWRAHFGQMAGSGAGLSANAAVPEPRTLFLFLVSIAASFNFRRAAVS